MNERTLCRTPPTLGEFTRDVNSSVVEVLPFPYPLFSSDFLYELSTKLFVKVVVFRRGCPNSFVDQGRGSPPPSRLSSVPSLILTPTLPSDTTPLSGPIVDTSDDLPVFG